MTDITILIQIVVQIGVPVLLGWLLTRRYAGNNVDNLRIFLGGMAGFAVAQALLLAFSQAASMLDLADLTDQWQMGLGALAFGVAVGVLEELARFTILRFWLRDVRSWGHGLMFGAGHGGAESIFSGIVGAIWFMTMRSLRAGPPPGETLSAADQANLDQIVASFWSTPWQTPLLSAAQQVFMVVLSLGLATLVMRVFLTGRLIYLPAAMIVHSAAAASLVFLGQIALPLSVAVAGAFAVLAVVIIVRYAEPPPEPATAPGTQATVESRGPKAAPRPRKKRTHKQ